VETIRAKQSYERLCMYNVFVVQEYLTGSIAFKSNKFVSHIRETKQFLLYCDTNAHHQNGVAEQAIQSISNMARAMILYSSMHCKDRIGAIPWPIAVAYATHIYNNTPNNGVTPMEILTGSTIPRHRLMDTHVWGCPVYILDPKVQQGQKLPRWQPCSHQGIFMGLSQQLTSEVHQVLNITTGIRTTQFQVVFENKFTTVNSIAREEKLRVTGKNSVLRTPFR
jgi:hypothetical protein